MGGMEFNKIFAAILVAGIVASLSGFISKKLVAPEELEENAFKVEVSDMETVAGGVARPQLPEPVLHLIASADIARGEKLAKACAACHSFEKGGPNGVGPYLWNTVEQPKHHASGYSYSGALLENGEPKWTYASLNHFLWKPKQYAPGTKMNYLGIKKPEDRAALIAWLRTIADSPAPLPSEAQIAAELEMFAPPEPEAPEETKDAPAEDGSVEESAEDAASAAAIGEEG